MISVPPGHSEKRPWSASVQERVLSSSSNRCRPRRANRPQPPALSVGGVVVEAGELVAVVDVDLAVVDVVPGLVVVVLVAVVDVVVEELPAVDPGALVVVAEGGDAEGATKGTFSLRMVARLAAGPVERPVQPRAETQLASAEAAGAPVNGWGSPPTMVAGRNVTPTTCRPAAVTMSDPLDVSGGVSS